MKNRSMLLLMIVLRCYAHECAAETNKPLKELVYIHSDSCQPCLDFDRDFYTDTTLRHALTVPFKVLHINLSTHPFSADAKRLWDAAYPYPTSSRIQVPAFIALRDGKVTHKHLGYISSSAGKWDLLFDLGLDTQGFSKSQATAEAHDVPQAKQEPKVAPKVDFDEWFEETDEATTLPYKSDQEPAPSKTTISDTTIDGVLKKVDGVASVGITGILMTYGVPAGIAGLIAGGVTYFGHRATKKVVETATGKVHEEIQKVRHRPFHQQPPPAPPPEDEQPNQRIEPNRNQYVHVPVDKFSEAYTWAAKNVVTKWPGTESTFVHLDSLIEKFLTSKKES